GQPPFPDSNVISQMLRHATEAPRPLNEFNPSVSDGLQQIVGWMMAKDPAQRYPTPGRAAQALQVFLAAESPPAGAPPVDAKMRSYLTWLEEGDEEAPAAKPVIPVAAPFAGAPAPKPVAAKPAGRKSRRHKGKKPPQAIPVGAGAGGPNVELLPQALPVRYPGRLSRRDFVAFGAGAASVLLAIFLGWVVAKLAG